MAQQKFSIWQRLGYALCNVGVSVGAVPVTLFLLYYLTEVVGMRASLAGLAIALPKVWDALIDPMFGGWIDRMAVRMGRRGPITMISAFGYLASLVFIFSLPEMQSPTQLLVVATLVLIISSISQTALGVNQFALATEMSSDPVELSTLLSIGAVTAQIFAVAFSIVAPLLIVWSGGGAQGYSRMAAEVACVAALAIAIFVFATRHVAARPKAAAAEEMPLLASIRATGSNHAFYYLIFFVICANAGAAIIFGFLPFANQYVLGGTHQSLAVLEGVLGLTVLGGMLAAPQFVRRLDPMQSMRLCNLIVGIMFCFMFAASFGPIWATWLALAGIGLGSGITGVLVQTTILSATKHTLRHGVIVGLGFYLGIMLAGIKLGTSLGVFVSGQLLDQIGFVPGGGVQAESTMQWLRYGYTLVPLCFVVAGSFFLQRVLLQAVQQRPLESAQAST